MKKTIKESTLRTLIRKELKKQIFEATTEPLETELLGLIDGIKIGQRVDKQAYSEHSDGELLAMYLNPILQGALTRLKDPNGFRKNLKI